MKRPPPGELMKREGLPPDTVIAVRKIQEGNGHGYRCIAEDPFEALAGLAVAVRSMGDVPGCPRDVRAALVRAAAELSHGVTSRPEVADKIYFVDGGEND